MLDHPRSAIAGISSILKFGLDPIYSFGDIAIFYILPFWLEIAYSRPFLGGFGGIFPPNMVPHRSNPQKAILARKHVVWAIKRENRSSGSTWAQDREKKGKDRTGPKKLKFIFNFFGQDSQKKVTRW